MLSLNPIGVIRSPYRMASGTPIQSAYADQSHGTVIVNDVYEPALRDIEHFERIWLCYWFDRAGTHFPEVIPYRDTQRHGLFSTRSPCRPNPIGLSVVRLLRREANMLRVADLDILDGTPLLDIKPYIPEFDSHPASNAGWFDNTTNDRRVADTRFHHYESKANDSCTNKLYDPPSKLR